jgi:hypothetical protein
MTSYRVFFSPYDPPENVWWGGANVLGEVSVPLSSIEKIEKKVG